MADSKLTPYFPYSASEAWRKQERRLRQQDTSKDLRQLEQGDNVRVQPLKSHDKEWAEATVSKQLTGRSYEVETNTGRKYRRNRRFLRPTPHSTHSFPVSQGHNAPTNPGPAHQQPLPQETPPTRDCSGNVDTETTSQPIASPAVNTQVLSRCGRTIRKPVRYRSE